MERQHFRPYQNRRADLPAAFDFLSALPYRLRYRHRLRRLAATIWTGIIPAMLLYRSRHKFGVGKNYKVYGGFWLMVWVFLFGIINIAAQILSQMELVPVFKG